MEPTPPKVRPVRTRLDRYKHPLGSERASQLKESLEIIGELLGSPNRSSLASNSLREIFKNRPKNNQIQI